MWQLILDGGNYFGGNFTFFGHDIEVRGTTFNGIVQITKYGNTNNVWTGDNVFASTTTITDSSSSGELGRICSS